MIAENFWHSAFAKFCHLRFQKQYHSRDPVSLIIFRSVNTWHMTSTDTGNTSLRPGMSTGSGIELTCKFSIFTVSHIMKLPKTRSCVSTCHVFAYLLSSAEI